jgi:hypothetical protein
VYRLLTKTTSTCSYCHWEYWLREKKFRSTPLVNNPVYIKCAKLQFSILYERYFSYLIIISPYFCDSCLLYNAFECLKNKRLIEILCRQLPVLHLPLAPPRLCPWPPPGQFVVRIEKNSHGPCARLEVVESGSARISHGPCARIEIHNARQPAHRRISTQQSAPHMRSVSVVSTVSSSAVQVQHPLHLTRNILVWS